MPTAVEYFLKLDGIKGESPYKDHSGYIEVESFSWGLSSFGSTGGGGGAGKRSFQDFHFTKTVDSTSPQLFLRCANGAHFPKVELWALKVSDLGVAAAAGPEFLKIALEDVHVSSFEQKADHKMELDPPQDSFSLNFSMIEFSVLSPNGDGQWQTADWVVKGDR